MGASRDSALGPDGACPGTTRGRLRSTYARPAAKGYGPPRRWGFGAESAHAQAVRVLERSAEELFGVPEVEKRIRVDTFEHYPEHTQSISRWLGGIRSRG